MASLYHELKALVAALNEEKVPYALCGGLAMGVHGFVRATVDIDLLVQRGDLERILSIAAGIGYTVRSKPMVFEGGSMEIHRAVKVLGEDEDPLMLDLLLVTSALEEVWHSREWKEWDEGALWVVSRKGLIRLKSMRGSSVDRADLERLGAEDENG